MRREEYVPLFHHRFGVELKDLIDAIGLVAVFAEGAYPAQENHLAPYLVQLLANFRRKSPAAQLKLCRWYFEQEKILSGRVTPNTTPVPPSTTTRARKSEGELPLAVVEIGERLYQGVRASEALVVWLVATVRGDRGQCAGGVYCLTQASVGSRYCIDHRCTYAPCRHPRHLSFQRCVLHCDAGVGGVIEGEGESEIAPPVRPVVPEAVALPPGGPTLPLTANGVAPGGLLAKEVNL